jgi:hypothetical protein
LDTQALILDRPQDGRAAYNESLAKSMRIPIVVYCGDDIRTWPYENRGDDNRRVCLAMAKQWTEAINRHGGDATQADLRCRSIRGITHFPPIDHNRLQMADLPDGFLPPKNLD